MKVVLAGGTGALGSRIAADLTARGDDIVILTRTSRPGSPYRQVVWDGKTLGPWVAELSGAALINLAGKLVDCRPTPANIGLLTRSRVESTHILAKAAASLDKPLAVWIQMSTLAIYGDGGEAILTENDAVADGPPQMAGVARAWEAAAAIAAVQRQVILRAGVVLDGNTPALRRLTGIVRWGLGGRVGTGQQWVSWLHIDDFLAIIRKAIDDKDLHGIVHATSPFPVRNTDLMSALRRTLHRPWAPPTPAPLVHMGTVLLRTDPALALLGRRCLPHRLLETGFAFTYPQLEPALRHLL